MKNFHIRNTRHKSQELHHAFYFLIFRRRLGAWRMERLVITESQFQVPGPETMTPNVAARRQLVFAPKGDRPKYNLDAVYRHLFNQPVPRAHSAEGFVNKTLDGLKNLLMYELVISGKVDKARNCDETFAEVQEHRSEEHRPSCSAEGKPLHQLSCQISQKVRAGLEPGTSCSLGRRLGPSATESRSLAGALPFPIISNDRQVDGAREKLNVSVYNPQFLPDSFSALSQSALFPDCLGPGSRLPKCQGVRLANWKCQDRVRGSG
ncbi:unnamed protein product [Nesidiocoris tenuis]|uniref:Uncharacterized protein n=1 Tax=Nesidiocoris tenuis TaxID=355587 RepID=A0A6H5GFC7_9HEMI|nr:unnamed protein product [Nesidiocoris tenuis]